MNGRVVNLSDSPHQQAQELMPWYVAGALDPAETLAVEQHLQGCVACQRELQWQREFGAAYRERAVVAPADADRALARLRPMLERTDPATPGQPRARAAGWRAWFGAGWSWPRYAVVAQFCVIAALGVALVARAPAPGYHLLGSAPPPSAATSLVVVFSPDARERDVIQVLRAAHARIVDGPTAANGYLLSIAGNGRHEALAALRAAPAVVVVAESLDDGRPQ